LRSLIGNKPGQWDLVIAQARITYNNLVNISIGKIPFQVVYCRSPNGILDLVKFLEVEDRRSINGNSFVERIHHIHEKVRKKLQQSNYI
jgi:hypothetical protein